MSLPDDILAILRASCHPMTNAQIRTELDLPYGTDPTTRVAGALNGLLQRGAIERTTAASGGYVYTPVKGWQPARRTGGVASVKGVTRASRRKATKPRPEPAQPPSAPLTEPDPQPAARPAKLADYAPADEAIRTGTVILPRATVRTLVAGVLMFGGNDLGDSLREAVIEATQEAA